MLIGASEMPRGTSPIFHRFNLYYRLEAFYETATYTGQELASSNASQAFVL